MTSSANAESVATTEIPVTEQATPGRAARSSSRQFGWLVVSAGGTRLIALLSQVVIARIIGPVEVGALAVAMAMSMGMAVLSDGGLTALSVRRLVRRPEDSALIVTATLVVQVSLTALLGGVLVAVGLLLPWQGDIGVLLALSAPALVCVAFNTLYVLVAAERIAAIAWLRLLLAAAPAALSVVAAVAFHRAVAVLLANLVGYVVFDAVVLRQARRTAGLRFTRRVSRDAVLEMCRSSAPMLGTAILLLVPTVAATVVAGAVLGPRATGVFSAAWQFSFALVGLWLLIVDVMYPVLVRLREVGDTAFAGYLDPLLAVGVRAALPISVFVTFAARPLVDLVYGHRYADAVDVLRILIWVLPLGMLWTALSQAMLAAGAERVLLGTTLLSNGVLIAACIVGGQLFGVRGVAAGSLVGGLVQVGSYATTRALRCARVLGTVARQAPYGLVPLALCLVGSVLGLDHVAVACALVATVLGGCVAEGMSRQKTAPLLRRVGAR